MWRDTDGNGEQDETESGIEGVSIQLRRYAADGNTLLPAIATEVVVSDANGWFQFFDLPEGEYGIEPDLSSLGAGYSFTRYNQGNSITRDSNVVPATGRARINLRRTGNGLAFDVGIIRSLLAATRLQFISDLQGYSGEVDFFACSTLAAPDLKAGQALSLTLLDGGDNPDSTCSTSKLEVLIKTKNGEQLFKETLSLPILESGQYGDYLLVLSGSFDSSDNLPIGVTPYLMKDESALFVNNFPDDGSQIAIKRLFSAEVPPALQEPIPVKYKESISGLKTVLSNAIPYHATGFEILKGGERLEAFEFPDNDSLDQTTYVMSAQPGAVNARPTLRRTTRKGGSQAVPSALASATSTEQLSRGPDAEIPAVFKLEANYPNPFSSTTTIPFRVAATGPVTIDLFDSIGRHITSLLDEPISSGLHQIDVSAAGLLNGVYFYRMQASGFRDVGTLIVRK